ncbi:MAG TPA: 1,2-phenylacetyl-CoA epoxidase subunit PaaD [Acidimicrobiales bacterium]|nr:1,2-phenylacetyl-CoA epoxidase subunit PaaD [Acidimicrobiales bacterium]
MVNIEQSSDVATARPTVEEITRLAASVADPEIPNLTIADLGILRDVRVGEDGRIEVDLTPTYSGCPAVEAIESDVRAAIAGAGYPAVTVRRVLAPAWTTDWISAEGRQKLAEVGIAPPGPVCRAASTATTEAATATATGQPVAFVHCPHCGSRETEILSRFSSTACKELRRCCSCSEPFDHFKPL